VAAKLHWVHWARTDRYTLITSHPKRGRPPTARNPGAGGSAPTRFSLVQVPCHRLLGDRGAQPLDLGRGFLQLDLLAGLAWAARTRRQRVQRALLGGAVDPPLVGGLALGVLLG